MTASRIAFPGFREEQSDSKYPFVDYATLQSDTGAVSFAKDVFIDATFYPIGGGTAIYLSTVIVATNKVTIVAETVAPSVAVTAEYDPLNLPTNNTLVFYDQYSRPAGLLLFNAAKIAEIYQWGFGTYVFTRRAAEIVATAFIPAQEPGVRALTLDDGTFITGDVCLVGSNGVVLRTEADNVIRLDIIGSPLFQREACDAAGKNKPPQKFVATINNCGPDEFGNFTITATDRDGVMAPNDTTVLRVYPTNFGIVIEAVGRSEV